MELSRAVLRLSPFGELIQDHPLALPIRASIQPAYGRCQPPTCRQLDLSPHLRSRRVLTSASIFDEATTPCSVRDFIVTAQARREGNIQMVRRFCCSGTETSLYAGPHTPSPVEFDPDKGRPASKNAVPQEVAHLAVLSIGGSQHNKTKNQ
jgi:hypothetical protein